MDQGIQELKRFLFELPVKSNFEFSDEVRKSIRYQLFKSITNDFTFLEWFFPGMFMSQDQNPINKDKQGIINELDCEQEWLYSNYYRYCLSHGGQNASIHNFHAYHSKRPCSRIFHKGEPIYRCLTCALDETCALCSNCYRPEFHKGHKVHVTICQRENGGVCDCCDPEAWLDAYDCPFASDSVYAPFLNEVAPEELKNSFRGTLESILDFIIDVISNADLQFYSPEEVSEEVILSRSKRASLSPGKYGFGLDNNVKDKLSHKYALMLYNDQVRHFRDAEHKIRLASKKVRPFATMVASHAEKHGKAKVISSSKLTTLKERQLILASSGLSTCIRNYRDVFREEMCEEIVSWLGSFTESEFMKANLDIRNLFCEVFCMRWKSGLALEGNYSKEDTYIYRVGDLDQLMRIPKIPSVSQDCINNDLKKTSNYWYFTPKKWEMQDQELCTTCEYNQDINDYLLEARHVGSRIQYLIFLDARLWKSIRIQLHAVFSTSLITNLTYKNIICSQYVDIYPPVADMFLTLDREPELSIMCTLATQLFTSPTNSTLIVRHNDLSRIFASIYGFLTVEKIISPPLVDLTHSISMKSLKNRRWNQIFFDIGYVLSRSEDSKSIVENNVIPKACDILVLFQGRPVMKRENKNHVEYENADYAAFFHAISVIYQFADYTSNCLGNSKTQSKENRVNYIMSIEYVIDVLLAAENNEYPTFSKDISDINSLADVKFVKEPIDGNVVKYFNINEERVSFLHPIHSLLSWLIERATFMNVNDLYEIFAKAASKFRSRNPTSKLLALSDLSTLIYEYPIRTIALMAQIKAGFWVRNGFSVRSQLQFYRNTGLRESSYLRDLFLSQLFICTHRPNVSCYLILNRWLLTNDYFEQKVVTSGSGTQSRKLSHSMYDSQTLTYMIEEMLNFFINVLTENLSLRGYSSDRISLLRVQNEIIHTLCFGTISYAKLCSLIPDHIVSDKKFDIILEEIAEVIQPEDPNGMYTFKLKPQYLESINPHFYSYTSNMKEDALKFLKDNISHHRKIPMGKVVIEPKLIDPNELGIYRYVGNFSLSRYFRDFLKLVLEYIKSEKPNTTDSLLSNVFYLIHICSKETYVDSASFGKFYNLFILPDQEGVSIASLLYNFLSSTCYAEHHATINAIFSEFESRYDTFTDMLKKLVPNFDQLVLSQKDSKETKDTVERKKVIALERQAKLLAKFKKQQSSFMKNNLDNVSSDAEMEDFHETKGWNFPEAHCMLCQNASEDAGPFGLICYVSKSSEFRNVPFDNDYWFLKSFSGPSDFTDPNSVPDFTKNSSNWHKVIKKVEDSNVVGPGFPQESIESKLVVSGCGHGMHFQCYLNYLNNSKGRLNQITRNTPESIDHKEFLCPLCKAINNLFIPILWTSNNRSLSKCFEDRAQEHSAFESFDYDSTQLNSWFPSFSSAVLNDLDMSSAITPAVREILASDFEDSNAKGLMRTTFSHMLQNLSCLTFPLIFRADDSSILTNSIESCEISLRGQASKWSVIEQVPNNTLVSLRSMNEFRDTSILVKLNGWMVSSSSSEHFLKILYGLKKLSKKEMPRSIFTRDFFELLVEVVPVPSLGFSYHEILKYCYYGHIVQTLYLIVCQFGQRSHQKQNVSFHDIPVISGLNEGSIATSKAIINLLLRRVRKVFTSNLDEAPSGEICFSVLVKCITPFLRRAAIYSYVKCANLDGLKHVTYESNIEANKLCELMGLVPLHIVLKNMLESENSDEFKIFYSFWKYFDDHITQPQNHILMKRTIEYPSLVKLIDLPSRLDAFFTNYYYSDKWDRPHMKIEDPAVCLFCAEVMDVQKHAIGSKDGQCTTHFLKECNNNIGLFLLPKDRCFLLLHKNGGSFYSAPYFNRYGEQPNDLKSSKCLHLMNSKYDDFIRNIWLSHNVVNEIARKLDNVMDPGGWATL